MLEGLLRRMMATGWRRGRSGSRTWMVIAATAAGIRFLQWVTRDSGNAVLYRTRVVTGDQFEIIASPPPKK